MAPAYAMPRMLDRAGLTLQDFDLYEIHEAFAAQVLCTLAAWEDPVFCRERLGRDEPLGRDRPRAAERQRRLARRRAPVRGDRRADRRGAGQGSSHARRPRPRRDQHLRRRRPGRRRAARCARERRRRGDERPLRPARQLAPGGADGARGRPAAARWRSSATAPATPSIAGAVLLGAAPGGACSGALATVLVDADVKIASTDARAARCAGAAAAAGPPRSSTPKRPASSASRASCSTPPGSPTRRSWSSCSASSIPRCGGCSAAGA